MGKAEENGDSTMKNEDVYGIYIGATMGHGDLAEQNWD